MTKQDIIQRINAVCRTMDTGITVTGIQNAANLAGCFSILQEILVAFQNEEIQNQSENKHCD